PRGDPRGNAHGACRRPVGRPDRPAGRKAADAVQRLGGPQRDPAGSQFLRRDMSEFKKHIAKAASGTPLSFDEARDAFDIMMSGQATPSPIGGFLVALRGRGETVGEISGAVATMRAKMLPVNAPANAIDIVGTGGDASGSYNVSTCAAFIAAGAGVP